MIKNKIAKWTVRILLLLGTIISLFFVPWILVKAWILPLPDTVQEQIGEAIGHGFDGMIVYINQAGKQPQFYTDAKMPVCRRQSGFIFSQTLTAGR